MAQEKAEVMGTDASRILVLDANIMLRAVLGTRVRSLIERYSEDVALFIPSYCVAEVHEYLPSLCAKRNWEPAPTPPPPYRTRNTPVSDNLRTSL